ncbi:hypothetical protein [uncultured Williamsia sp.]|uniref:hypothetical protein n=1 Tax=uncultured Williamsia sp. TaxID=259311 RepID=UPI00262C2B6B|nr:hypothetical protein [uncultured Williamsia sp.]
MTAPAGVGGLLRLAARTERIPGVAGALVVPVLLGATAAALTPLYPDRASRLDLAAGAAANPVFRVLLGPLRDVSGVGVLSVWRIGLPALLVIAILAAATVTRNLRGAEATGRMELLRSAAVAPLAPLVSAVAVALSWAVATAAPVVVVAAAVGVPIDTAAGVGAQVLAAAVAGIGIAVVVDQVVTTSRTALATSAGVLVVAFLVRGVADAADGWSWLAWVSPLGWVERIDPLGGFSPTGLVACLVLLVVGVATATVIARRRDLGAGLVHPRPGPDRARLPMRLPTVTAVTIGPSLRPWLGGSFAYCVLVGLLLASAGSLVGSGGTADLVEKLGRQADLTDALANTVLGIVGVVAAAAGVAVVGATRGDDRAGRGEMLLATAVSPVGRYLAATGLVVVATITVPVLAACGMGLGRALTGTADGPSTGEMIAAATVGMPATWVVASIGLAAYGLRPRLVALGWVAVVVDLLLGPLGVLLGAPSWLRDVAPHTHLAATVGSAVPGVPVASCLAVGVVLAAVGAAALRRRDLT